MEPYLSLYQKGKKARIQGNYQVCIVNWQQALQIGKDNNDSIFIKKISMEIGSVFYEAGKYLDALSIFQDALREAEKYNEVDDIQRIGIIHSFLGAIQLNIGRYKRALPHFQQALSIAKETNSKEDQERYYNNLGAVYKTLGKFDQALKTLEQALVINQELQNLLEIKDLLDLKKGEAIILNNIGTVYRNSGIFSKAVEYFNNALAIHQKFGFKKGGAKVLNNLGLTHYNQGEMDKALELYKKSLASYKEINDYLGESKALNNIGILYHHWGKLNESLDYYEQALTRVEKYDDKHDKVMCLNNIGEILRIQNQYNNAMTRFQQGLNIAEKFNYKQDQATLLNNVGLIYIEWKQFKEALKCFTRAKKISNELGDPVGLIKSLDNLGGTFGILGRLKIENSKNNFELALQHFRQARSLAEEIGDKYQHANVLKNIGKIFQYQENYSKSVDNYRESFLLLDELSSIAPNAAIRISARSEQHRILKDIIYCFLALKEKELALAYIEHNKGREMMLFHSIIKPKSKIDLIHLIDQINKRHEILYNIEQQLKWINEQETGNVLKDEDLEDMREQRKKAIKQQEQITKEQKQLRQDLWLNYPTKGTLIPPEPLDLIKKFKEEINPQWLILDFYYNETEGRLFIFVIQKEKEILVFTKSLKRKIKEISASTKEFIELRRKKRSMKEAENKLKLLGEVLYKIFIPLSLRKYIQNIKFEFITIIPTGIMHGLPLELIYDGENYWGLKYNLSRAFNLQTLLAAIAIKTKRGKKAGLIVGNPTIGIKEIPYQILDARSNREMGERDLGIAHASEETNLIKDILRQFGFEIDSLMEYEANIKAFLTLLNDKLYSLIHFSGHAFFDTSNPEMSYLLLREGNNPIKLYGNRVPLEVSLSGKPLVVLSACETGGVDIQVGDEIFGLARGFIEAGASGILITGWNVFSDSPIDFFSTFYKQLMKGVPISEALKLARIDVHTKAQETISGEEIHFAEDVDLLHWGPFRFYGLPF